MLEGIISEGFNRMLLEGRRGARSSILVRGYLLSALFDCTSGRGIHEHMRSEGGDASAISQMRVASAGAGEVTKALRLATFAPPRAHPRQCRAIRLSALHSHSGLI